MTQSGTKIDEYILAELSEVFQKQRMLFLDHDDWMFSSVKRCMSLLDSMYTTAKAISNIKVELYKVDKKVEDSK